MGYKSLIFILIISILSISCSTVNYSTQQDISSRNYSVFNRFGSKYTSIIQLLNGTEVITNYVKATDSLVFYQYNGDTLSIKQSKIEKIEIKVTGNRIANGLLWGVLGLATGIAITFILVPDCNGPGCGFLIIPILLMGVVSSISGYIKGNKKYIFNSKADYEQIEYYKRKESLNSK